MSVRDLLSRLPVGRQSRRLEDERRALLRAAYLALLGREPDAPAFEMHLAALRAGRTWERVLYGIAASPEFLQRHEAMARPRSVEADEALVRGAYRALLQRDVDIEGLAWHVGRLQNGGTVEALLGDLLSGEEILVREPLVPEADGRSSIDLAHWREQLAVARRLAILEDRVESLMKVRGW
jgi:hypothetical protein